MGSGLAGYGAAEQTSQKARSRQASQAAELSCQNRSRSSSRVHTTGVWEGIVPSGMALVVAFACKPRCHHTLLSSMSLPTPAPCSYPFPNLQAAPDATGLGCNVSVHVAVPFNKRCMVKGLITNTTYKDCQVRGSTQPGMGDCSQHLCYRAARAWQSGSCSTWPQPDDLSGGHFKHFCFSVVALS